ncbi:Hint domain-containing protein [Pseudomonas sp. NPDC090233]|uniref:Hint domain-containing protein n=1 Tax=Pseudomonas sp. NPDC090233 TaxID=3364479 RepID=UPI00383B2A99
MPPRTLNSIFLRIVLTLSFLFAPVGVSSVSADTSKVPKQLSAEAKKDLDAFYEEIKSGIPHKLDLANPLHFRVIMAALEQAGVSKERSPQLYNSLNHARAEGTAALAKSGAAPAKALAIEGSGLQNLNFISLLTRDDSTLQGNEKVAPTFKAVGMSSTVNGSDNTTILMNLYSVETGNIYATNQGKEFAEGTNFSVTVSGQPPADVQNLTTRAMAFFVVYPKNSDVPEIITQSAEFSALPLDSCLDKPNYCKRNGDGSCTSEHETSCTNKATRKPAVKLCWNRGSQQECDYWNSTGYPENFVFPMSGWVNFKNSVPNTLSGQTTIYIKNSTGGGCTVKAEQDGLLDPKYWSVEQVEGKERINWKFDATSFENDQDCVQTLNGAIVDLFVQHIIQLNGSPTEEPSLGSVIFTSDQNFIGLPGVAIIPKLDVMQGCLAEGTPITLADGSTKSVEAFKGTAGELVKTANGTDKPVIGTTAGSEPHPMIRVKTDAGQNVLMTRSHPVVLSNGLELQARYLKPGDEVVTLNGVATITTVDYEKYTGKVHNLVVGTRMAPGTYYAGGILTGDVTMQQALAETTERAPLLTREERRALVPKEWLKDFDNNQ